MNYILQNKMNAQTNTIGSQGQKPNGSQVQAPEPNGSQINIVNELLNKINILVSNHKNCKHVEVSVPGKNSKNSKNSKNGKKDSYNVVVCKK